MEAWANSPRLGNNKGMRNPTQQKAFDVVMLRNGVNEATATRKDFRRVTVMATDPLEAMQTVEQYHAACAAKRRPPRRIQTWQILARKQGHGKSI